MKYLALAYGDEKDWQALTKSEQDALLAQDECCGSEAMLLLLWDRQRQPCAPGMEHRPRRKVPLPRHTCRWLDSASSRQSSSTSRRRGEVTRCFMPCFAG